MARVFDTVSSTVTISIASPAVVSWTGHGLAANDLVYLSTTGALPTGLTSGGYYYVMSAGLTANTFQLSTSGGGSAINTSGTQSGTHTCKAYCQYLQTDNVEVTAAPMTLSAWVKPTTGGTQHVVWVGDSTTSTNYFALVAGVGTVAGVFIRSSAAGEILTYSNYSLPANEWSHVCATFTSTTSRAIYVNGGTKNTSTTSVSPATPNRTAIARRSTSSPNFSYFGLVAHAAIWNVALTDLEVAALAGGADPRTIQSSALKNYVPMTSNASPETDTQQSGYTFTVRGGATFDADNGPSGRNPYVQKSRVNSAVTRAATR